MVPSGPECLFHIHDIPDFHNGGKYEYAFIFAALLTALFYRANPRRARPAFPIARAFLLADEPGLSGKYDIVRIQPGILHQRKTGKFCFNLTL
jgi:hypothetical protein